MPPEYVPTLQRAAATLAAIPGIRVVTPTLNPPLTTNGGWDAAPRLEGQTVEEATLNPYLSVEAVFPDYLEALGIPVVEGRALAPEDGAGGPPAIVVSATAASALWPGESAVGQVLNLGFPGYESTWWRVVGVADDSRYRAFPEPRPTLYLPLTAFQAIPPSRLLVRTGSDSSSYSWRYSKKSGSPGRRRSVGRLATSVVGGNQRRRR